MYQTAEPEISVGPIHNNFLAKLWIITSKKEKKKNMLKIKIKIIYYILTRMNEAMKTFLWYIAKLLSFDNYPISVTRLCYNWFARGMGNVWWPWDNISYYSPKNSLIFINTFGFLCFHKVYSNTIENHLIPRKTARHHVTV